MSTTLLHPRIARNLEQMGFFPTDDGTLRGIANLLAPGEEAVKLLDPCCGNGDALIDIARHYPFAETYGIELDEGRAATAKPRLFRLLQGSALDATATPQSVDLLFLNPPYGDALRDKESTDKAERLEHQFLSRFFPALRSGGLLIYIVPKHVIDGRLQKWLLGHFDEIGVYEAATDRFNQLVFIGRKAGGVLGANKTLLARFAAWQSGEEPWPTLPEYPVNRYRLDGNPKTLRLASVDVTATGVAELLADQHGLWRDFDAQYAAHDKLAGIRPLHDLTDWHTVLLISAGVVSGLVDNGTRTLLVKGRTSKSRVIKLRKDDEGTVTAEEHRDRYNTIVKGIDLTIGSPAYGRIVIIQ